MGLFRGAWVHTHTPLILVHMLEPLTGGWEGTTGAMLGGMGRRLNRVESQSSGLSRGCCVPRKVRITPHCPVASVCASQGNSIAKQLFCDQHGWEGSWGLRGAQGGSGQLEGAPWVLGCLLRVLLVAPRLGGTT